MEEKNSYLSADPETIRQIDEKMPPEEELQDLAEFFKVFGDATRLKILSVLLCSEMCVYDIATLLGMSQSAISHQLRVLKQMDLVKNRRDGKTIFYALADDHIITILNQERKIRAAGGMSAALVACHYFFNASNAACLAASNPL